MLRCLFCLSVFTVFVLGCDAEPTNQDLCEASETCEVSGSEGDLTFNCVAGMKWEDMDDPANFNCITCDEGLKWANDEHADHNCVPICKYPENFNAFGFVNDCADGQSGTLCEAADAPPPYAWAEALTGDGTKTAFSMEEWYCDENSDDIALIMVVVATWCGYCPDYVAMVGANADALKEAGAKIVYVVEDPASNDLARGYINGYIGPDNAGLRVGDQMTLWQYDDGEKVENKAGSVYGSPAISGIPTAFVVKRDTLQVIASQSASQYQLNFTQILEDIKSGAYDDPQ
jgi:thiol-disulfide isomerase/thioredoxin